MAPSASAIQAPPSKIKRPGPIQTNGIMASSSPSPSMSANRLASSAKYPPGSATSNGGGNSSGSRSANRMRRDTPAQLLGRGQRNSSAGLRSGSIINEIIPAAQPPPFIKTDSYILKKYRGNPPSLIIHLHPTHFRFDQQEGSFSYKSPMRILIEHLRMRTIPHDLMHFFTQSGVEFYEGCMIVQIHDHKSGSQSQGPNQDNAAVEKAVPFSVHNYNKFLTPSPFVPFPKEENPKPRISVDGDKDTKSKSSAQIDKENMPAPSVPNEGQRGKAPVPVKKAPVSTVVLHPTPLTLFSETSEKFCTPRADGREARQEANTGNVSATVPPTPVAAVPPTPSTNMAPPAKKLKKQKMELDGTNVNEAISQIILTTTAPLLLDPVSNATECAALLESLRHPMHSEKPPSPKTRKRTVAEMAADEALAAEQERYMLTMDERLYPRVAGAPGGANPADGDGQAGGSSFEPRFERFKTLENIRNLHAEKKRQEKTQQAEAERRQVQDRERDRLKQQESERKEAERQRTLNLAQATAARQQQQAQQEAHRRAQIAQQQSHHSPQVQQGLPSIPPPNHVQHAHPQPNNLQNGMPSQPQRFHQQVSQAQASSPIVRNGTPHSNSSPTVNNMNGIPMQPSTSGMGGSPPRPGSVVQQNHPQMGAPAGHGMAPQRSQQSHAGTPRMPSATPNPNIQTTPLNRQMSATPRMSQASPLQGQMAPAPQMGPVAMNANGQPMNMGAMTPQQQQMLVGGLGMNPQQQMLVNGMTPQQQQQIFMQRRMQQLAQQGHIMPNQQNPGANGMGGMMNGQQMNPQMLAAQQAAFRQMQQQGGHMPQNQPNQQNFQQAYQAHLVNLQQQQHHQQQQQQRGNPQPMATNPGFMNGNQGNMQQMQPQMPPHPQQMNPQMQQQLIHKEIMNRASMMWRERLLALQNQYPQGIPDEVNQAQKFQCQQMATQQVRRSIHENKQRQLAQQMAQQGGIPQNMGIPNGMGMPRQQGM